MAGDGLATATALALGTEAWLELDVLDGEVIELRARVHGLRVMHASAEHRA
ncbi:MAG: hypothetical protein ACPGUV_07705 [Polyangiales bacterium]